MKRTQNINSSHFRKSLRVAPIAIALSSVLLAGCENNDENVTYFQTQAQCEQLNPQNQAECAQAYQHAASEAVNTAPKYSTQEECVAEFGTDQCVSTEQQVTANQPNSQTQTAQASSGSFWMPLMAGYMMGNMMNSGRANSQPMFSSKNPASPMYGKFVDASGKTHGSATPFRSGTVPKSDLAPKPAQTSTVSRGGFGQQVAAKSAAMNASSNKSSSSSTTRSSSSSSRSFGG